MDLFPFQPPETLQPPQKAIGNLLLFRMRTRGEAE